MSETYDPIPDVAYILAKLQVPLSIAGGAFLGEARPVLERLRFELDLFGYPDAAEHERALRKAMHAAELPPDPVLLIKGDNTSSFGKLEEAWAEDQTWERRKRRGRK